MVNNIGRAAFFRASLLLVVLSQPLAIRAADCEPELLADVRLRIASDGRVYLPAAIGSQEVYFVLSMGSGLPMVRESSANALGLPFKRITGNGRFSPGITHYVQLEGLTVGDFRFANRAAPVTPDPNADNPQMLEGRLVAGTIGSTLFQYVDVELNLAEQQMKLFRRFRCMGRSPVYWSADATALPMRFDQAGALVFTLELNGRKVEASMLSGTRNTTIDANAARDFFGFDENSADVEVIESGDGSPRRVFHAMSLAAPGLQIPETKVQLRPGGCKLTASTKVYGAIGYTSCVSTVPFNLGIDLLTQMRIYVSSQRQAVFFTFNPTQP